MRNILASATYIHENFGSVNGHLLRWFIQFHYMKIKGIELKRTYVATKRLGNLKESTETKETTDASYLLCEAGSYFQVLISVLLPYKSLHYGIRNKVLLLIKHLRLLTWVSNLATVRLLLQIPDLPLEACQCRPEAITCHLP